MLENINLPWTGQHYVNTILVQFKGRLNVLDYFICLNVVDNL